MNAAEQLDDHRSGGRLPGVPLAESPAGQQDTEAGAGIRIHQEEHALAHLRRLLYAQRRHDSMVDGVVQEEHLGRIHQHCQQRVEFMGEHPVHAGAQQAGYPRNGMPYHQIAGYGQQHGDYAEGEIVYQHLEAGADFPLHQLVEAFHAPAGDRTHYHRSQEHGGVGTYDDAHGRNGARHSPSVAADVLAGRERYQRRQQVLEHRRDQLGNVLVGPPASGDKYGSDKAPGDERPDIGHHHGAEGASEFLDFLFHYRM